MVIRLHFIGKTVFLLFKHKLQKRSREKKKKSKSSSAFICSVTFQGRKLLTRIACIHAQLENEQLIFLVENLTVICTFSIKSGSSYELVAKLLHVT